MKITVAMRNGIAVVSIALGVCVTGMLVQSARTAPLRRPLPAADLLTSIPAPSRSSLSDKEIARWTETTRKNPKDAKAWSALGDSLMQKGRETADVSYYSHAERVYKKGLELDPKCLPATLGLAWVSGGRHEFEQSIVWANKAIALDSGCKEAFGLIGDAAVEMGDYDNALKQYQKMLDLKPDISSYSRGAHLLFLSGNVRKANWLMQKAITCGSPYAENTTWCRAQLGLILYNYGYVVPAEQVLKDAEARSPHNYHVLSAMGKVQAALKHYPEAIGYYKRAIEIAPQHEAVMALGDLYGVTGKRDEAEKQYQLLESIHKINEANGVRGDMQMALFYADHNRSLPEALSMAREEYRVRKNVYAADTLAWCLYKNGLYREANEVSREALRRNTPDAGFHYHAGMIASKLGDRVTASKQLSRALSMNPGFSVTGSLAASDELKRLGSSQPDSRTAMSN